MTLTNDQSGGSRQGGQDGADQSVEAAAGLRLIACSTRPELGSGLEEDGRGLLGWRLRRRLYHFHATCYRRRHHDLSLALDHGTDCKYFGLKYYLT